MDNKVQLIGFYGGDITHASSAWTSTSRELTEEKLSRVDKLLNMLASSGHETPFEKSSLHFLCTTDIASHIHLIKHRIGVSVNAESARYKELNDDKYYIPNDWPEEEKQLYIVHLEDGLKKYHSCLERLVTLNGFSKKRAKESARFYLPYGNQITCDVMFNFRSFYHFLKLRYSIHAQKEIKDIAEKMLILVADIKDKSFNKTLKAFKLIDEYGKIRMPYEE